MYRRGAADHIQIRDKSRESVRGEISYRNQRRIADRIDRHPVNVRSGWHDRQSKSELLPVAWARALFHISHVSSFLLGYAGTVVRLSDNPEAGGVGLSGRKISAAVVTSST